MQTLSCCLSECTDIVNGDGFNKRGPCPLYYHSSTWDCIRYKSRHTHRIGYDRYYPEKRPDGSEEDAAAADDPFCEYFRQLPNELKLKCLLSCGFHALADTQLWMEDFDSFFTKEIMRDYHMTGPRCDTCEVRAVALSRKKTRIHIGLPFNMGLQSYAFVPFGSKYRTTLATLYRQQMENRVGRVNRYPSFYYRKCQHFDRTRVRSSKSDFKKSIAERWRRLQRFTGSTTQIDTFDDPRFHKRSFKKLDYVFDPKGPVDDRVTPLVVPVSTALEPGMYYWEFVHYNWEDAVAAIDGDESRQRHFFLDPSDTSHAAGDDIEGLSRRMHMSLLFRRVCHPNEEADDRYTPMGEFYGHSMPIVRYGNEYESVYFVLCEDGRKIGEGNLRGHEVTYQPVYRHVLTPALDVHVFKATDRQTGKNVSYYRVDFPTTMTLYSLDRNDHTIRLNFYTDTEEMTKDEKSHFGANLVMAVRSRLDMGYAFMSSNGTSLPLLRTREVEDVFGLLYQSTDRDIVDSSYTAEV